MDEPRTAVGRREAVVRRLVEEGFSGGRVDVVDELFAEGFVERWGAPDRFAQLAQLGLLPPMP